MDSETQNIKASVHLLQPVVLKLNIRRSLSPWYKKLPAIDVSGELETTDVLQAFPPSSGNVFQSDFTTSF